MLELDLLMSQTDVSKLEKVMCSAEAFQAKQASSIGSFLSDEFKFDLKF